MGQIRVIPLGGTGEIGKNCTVVETETDLFLVDCGISFPHEEHHGVDIVIPDFTYLLERKDKFRGIIITHAHEDHVGALSFLLPQINVPVYATPLAEALVRSKLEERVKHLEPNFQRMVPGVAFELAGMKIEPIRVTHSIPETCAIAFHTEHGIILFTADFKLDASPVDHLTSDVRRLAEIGEEGVLLLLCDSTNIDRQGWSPSESEVGPSLKEIFHKADGRVLVTQFSSNIHRMQQIVDAAYATKRKVVVGGRRMDMTFQLMRRMGYLKVEGDIVIPHDEAKKYKDHELAIIVTGSQGEKMAALSQMSRGEYSRLKIMPGDTVVYSARPIPGNEGGIWRVVNNLVRRGAKIIDEFHSPIHVSGHAYRDEIKEMIRLTKPFYVAPVHGEPRHQQHFRNMLLEDGHAEHRVFVLDNGDQLVINDERAWIDDEKVFSSDVYIDQHGNAVVSQDVLRQRTSLANDGVVVLTIVVDKRDGAILNRPRADVSGFVASGDAVEDILDDLNNILGRLSPAEISQAEFLEATVLEASQKIIWRRTSQKPVVIPIVEAV